MIEDVADQLHAKYRNRKANAGDYSQGSAFKFRDGSSVELKPAGMLLMKSSRSSVPTIYIASILHINLAAATETHFSGNLVFFKSGSIIRVDSFYQTYYKKFIDAILAG